MLAALKSLAAVLCRRRKCAGCLRGNSEGERAMKRLIGDVQSMTDGPPNYESGFGFVLYDDAGMVCASFMYPDEATADMAANLFTKALNDVKRVRGR
jgi:hypothetical protein